TDDKPGGNFEVTVGGDHDLHVKGNQYDGVDKDYNQTVKGNVVYDHQGDNALMVGGKSEHNAKETIVEAASKMRLKVGASFVVMEASGVTSVGPVVKINSGGAATPVATQTITDPNDAAPADTGEPGDVDKITGVEAPTLVRKPRVVPAQHGLTIVRLPDGTM